MTCYVCQNHITVGFVETGEDRFELCSPHMDHLVTIASNLKDIEDTRRTRIENQLHLKF